MRYYAALFLPVVEGGYAVIFPDIPEAFTQGEDPQECMSMAKEVLSIAVEEYAKARRELPAPSSLEQVRAIMAEEMKDESVDAAREPLLQLFAAPSVDLTPVKISISVPKSALAAIDAKAASHGMTRSGFLVAAAQSYA